MAPQTKAELKQEIQDTFRELSQLIQTADDSLLTRQFAPAKENARCTTFEQGNNMRDILMHIYEWQRLQSLFVSNIRKGSPKDFIPEPYRRNYKEMDRLNMEKHQQIPFKKSWELLSSSHEEMLSLLETFTEEELFGKKVFKVTYTTTMAAYFISVTSQPYSKAVKKLKNHIKLAKT